MSKNWAKSIEQRRIAMQEYAPSKTPSLIIESDGNSWFFHDSTFTNIQEDSRVAFGKTPAEALNLFIEKFGEPTAE